MMEELKLDLFKTIIYRNQEREVVITVNHESGQVSISETLDGEEESINVSIQELLAALVASQEPHTNVRYPIAL